MLSVLLLMFAFNVSEAQAQCSGFACTVNDSGDSAGSSSDVTLRYAITYANANPGTAINFSNAIAGSTITLTSELPLILNTGTVINGGNNKITVSGADTYRAFFIGGQAGQPSSMSATISNLTIRNANARGGNGSGGGAGLGGAIFVSSTGSLTLTNVALIRNAATGGNGGSFIGGGGMGGNGGASGVGDGGGGFGNNATGGFQSSVGSTGAFTGGASGGAGSLNSGINGISGGGSSGGATGGGGGGGVNNGTGGGGGVGGGNGGGCFGGVGGFGGGGGGGAGVPCGVAGGGSGGFGGGGGGGYLPGRGGFAGGGGSGAEIGGTGGFAGGNNAGGGAGLGGSIFVMGGGSLTVGGTLSVNGSSVAGGSSPGFGAAGSAFGAGFFLNGYGTLTFQSGSGQTQTESDAIADQNGSGGALVSNGVGGIGGVWGLTKAGAGTLTLSAVNVYTGTTTINGGTLEVDGSIAPSSLTTVNSGGALMGIGMVGNTTVANGGIFMPGNGTPGSSMTVSGNLAFESGALYLVQLNPATSSLVNVRGTAALGGATVSTIYASGSYVSKQYTILTATGGVSGTFGSLVNTNLPPNFTTSLSYDANDAYLNIKLNFSVPNGLTVNQQNVGSALTNFFNTTGSIPLVFGVLSPAALTQLDGEAVTGAERGAFQLMNAFLGLMLDPFVDDRGGNVVGGRPAMGLTREAQASLPPDIALAYARVLKAPPPQTIEPRWNIWGAAYGGTNSASGNAATGSNNVTAATYGFASGLDYRLTPSTVIGLALAGGGTSWGLAQAIGSGWSDAFQAGVYGITHAGPAYLSEAIAFTNNWFTTRRTALGNQLTAGFTGQSYGARIEGGYRYPALPTLGVTPYAAVQAQTFHTPAYNETDLTGGGGFGLSYVAMTATDVRTEFGSRFDATTLLSDMPLILRSRIAWAHDFVGNPSLNATFQALPGASFTVNGAPIPRDAALASAGAELVVTSHLSVLAKLDSAFAARSQTYAGMGTVRYTW